MYDYEWWPKDSGINLPWLSGCPPTTETFSLKTLFFFFFLFGF